MMADRQYNFPTIDSTHSIIQVRRLKDGVRKFVAHGTEADEAAEGGWAIQLCMVRSASNAYRHLHTRHALLGHE